MRWPGRIGVAALCIGALLAGLRTVPATPLSAHAPLSRAVYAEGGELLRLTLARDDHYRLWVPLSRMPPHLIEAVLLYEDRWFQWHPGVNLPALARGAWSTYSGGARLGGSTLTMQLARRLYHIDSRRPAGKLTQVLAALWLEARYSKRDLLEAYLNLAPYGGNIEGVGAASLAYFDKDAAALTLPESIALAVIPQNPAKRNAVTRVRGEAAAPPALADARLRLFEQWSARHPANQALRADSVLSLKTRRINQLPFRAPHVVEHALATQSGGSRDLRLSLDWKKQQAVERVLARYIESRKEQGIRNAAVLLLDADTMQVKALAGSADYFNAAIDGQVNAIAAKRSPGSTLKPFLYALALDQGVLHTKTVLKDAPTAFGPFSPENFDGRFMGPVAADEALIRSRNVPAVSVAARLSRPSLYDFLKASGVARMASEAHYGLALSLGGGEVTMEELARLYAMLANGGQLRPVAYLEPAEQLRPVEHSRPVVQLRPAEQLRPAVHLRPAEQLQPVEQLRQSGTAPVAAARLLSEEAAFVTLNMLEANPRPDTFSKAVPAVAWKTGTSWGFRDAWSAGVFGRHVLVVWAGNFDGAGNPALVGVQAAAPLFFQIIDALRADGLSGAELPRHVPPGVARVEVCAASGDLPNLHCPVKTAAWFIPGKSPIRISTLHRAVWLDAAGSRASCRPIAGGRMEVHEYWPSDLARLFRDAGMPRRAAPVTSDCSAADAEEERPQITSPLRAVTYTLKQSRPEPLRLAVNRAAGAGAAHWFADNAYLGRAAPGESLAWQPGRSGRYLLRVVDEAGRADAREVRVEFID